MILKKLSFSGFRNLEDGFILPGENVNIIYGENAQGKTNILEALWIISGLRSFRGAKDNELVSFTKQNAVVKAEFFMEERLQDIEIRFISGKKEVYLNGVKKISPAELGGKFPVVVFSPEHLSLVKDGPKERRFFVDSAIAALRPAYGVLLKNFSNALKQKNAVLKQGIYDMIPIWDEKLSEIGGRIIYQRINYIKILEEIASKFQDGISENKEEISIFYSTCESIDKNDDVNTVCKKLFNYLSSKHELEKDAGYVRYGPQRDDMEILINGKKARLYASQGQQRSIVLSIKLAEGKISEIKNGERPLFLLDDVLSELDDARQEYLINQLKDKQIFISTCDSKVANKNEKNKLFLVKSGKIVSKDNA